MITWDGGSGSVGDAQWRVRQTLRGHGDGRLLTDADPGLDAPSKRFIGEQPSQVKHI